MAESRDQGEFMTLMLKSLVPECKMTLVEEEAKLSHCLTRVPCEGQSLQCPISRTTPKSSICVAVNAINVLRVSTSWCERRNPYRVIMRDLSSGVPSGGQLATCALKVCLPIVRCFPFTGGGGVLLNHACSRVSLEQHFIPHAA